MTHMTETDFWIISHESLLPVSSDTRFWRRLEHCSIPSHNLAYMWLKCWFVIGHSLVLFTSSFLTVRSCKQLRIPHLCQFQPFSAPKTFFRMHYGTKTGAGIDLSLLSGTCVTDLRFLHFA